MKKIQKIFIALSTMILLLSNIFSTIIYANELHKNIEQNKENILANENISRLSSEVTTIYRELIQYDQLINFMLMRLKLNNIIITIMRVSKVSI